MLISTTLSSFIILTVCSASFSEAADKTLEAKAHGNLIVEAAIKKVQDSCIFTNDHQFLRRIAWVQTQFGDNPSTFQSGHLGGIWHLDQAAFSATKNASAFKPAGRLHKLMTDIQNKMHISYQHVSYTQGGLNVPLYGALAARLYFEHVAETTSEPIPYGLNEQADYWAKHYNGGRENLNHTAFEDMVEKIPPLCNSAGADILFILDSSGSVGLTDYNQMKQFVQKVVHQSVFPIGPKGYKFAVDIFSTSPSSQVLFNGYNNNVTELVNQIGNIPYEGDSTNTGGALYHALNVSFNMSSGQGARDPTSGYPRIVVVITDGQSNDGNETKTAATVIKENGLVVFTVGVGAAFNDQAAKDEVTHIASYPKCMHCYLLSGFDILDGFTAEIKSQTCQTSAVIVPDQGEVTNSVRQNQYLYFQFNANSAFGITFQLYMREGSVTLYLSWTVRNPNEVAYDYAVNATIQHSNSIHILPPISNQTNDTQSVFGSVKGLESNNDFTMNIDQGSPTSVIPTSGIPTSSTSSVSPTTSTSSVSPTTSSSSVIATTSTSSVSPTTSTSSVIATTSTSSVSPTTSSSTVSPGSNIQVYLEYFDNTAGGGLLYQTNNHCDPFWFTGLDQCDMAMQICIEPLQASKDMGSCQSGWIDLGQVTTNNNNATFAGQFKIGGWSNPMSFPMKKFPWTVTRLRNMEFMRHTFPPVDEKCACEDTKTGIIYDFCYHLPTKPTIFGKKFNCSWLEALKNLSLIASDNYINLESEAFPEPAFVTGSSKGKFGIQKNNIALIQQHFPTKKIFFYDLALKKEEKSQVTSYCNVIYRRFEFEKYPSYVQNLREYRWKPLIIAEALKEFGAIWWMDASIQLHKGNLSHVYQLLECRKWKKKAKKHMNRPPGPSHRPSGWVNESGLHKNLWNLSISNCDKFSYMLMSYTGHGIFAATNPGMFCVHLKNTVWHLKAADFSVCLDKTSFQFMQNVIDMTNQC